VLVHDLPTPPAMSSQLMPAIERVALLPALSVTAVAGAPAGSRYTYDFGQQVAGRTRLAVPPGAPAGSNFTLKHSEVLSHPPFADYDGSAWLGNLFWAYPVDSYISAGRAGETYEPSFTEHGFRFVELSAEPPLAAPPPLAALTAVVLRTAVRPQAALTLGHPLLQALSNASWWTEAAALMGIPAGTAARGERTGWTGDAAFASESELFDFDTGAFFAQFLQQLRQLQCADGTVPSCIPNTDPERDGPPAPLPCTGAEGDPSWGTVYPTIAWGSWKYYGLSLRSHYPSLQAYMAMLERAVNATGLARIFCEYGDWNPAREKTDCRITAAASYLHDLEHMAELAAALGEAADAAAFAARLAARRLEYHAAFWSPALGLYGAGTQTAQAVALWTGVAAGAGVAANVSAWLGGALSSSSLAFGFIGVRYVFEALALNGGIAAALRTLLQTEAPSFGYELYHLYEPTSNLWESFDAPTHRQWLDESSRSHHYQASINTFLRKHVAGLDMPPGAAAWSAVSVRPYAALPLPADLAAALPHARVTLAAHRGLIEVSWARAAAPGGGVQLNVTLPSGSGGTVSVPKAGEGTAISEGGAAVWAAGAFVAGTPGVLAAVDEGDFVTFNVTSGAFVFVATA
jgi:alpha-L-rhamnosidase